MFELDLLIGGAPRKAPNGATFDHRVDDGPRKPSWQTA